MVYGVVLEQQGKELETVVKSLTLPDAKRKLIAEFRKQRPGSKYWIVKLAEPK